MSGSRRLAMWCIVALMVVGAAAGSAAAQAHGSGDHAPSSSAYDARARESLIARRSAFEPGDGLQRWERLLLAMDPNGRADPGR